MISEETRHLHFYDVKWERKGKKEREKNLTGKECVEGELIYHSLAASNGEQKERYLL